MSGNGSPGFNWSPGHPTDGWLVLMMYESIRVLHAIYLTSTNYIRSTMASDRMTLDFYRTRSAGL